MMLDERPLRNILFRAPDKQRTCREYAILHAHRVQEVNLHDPIPGVYFWSSRPRAYQEPRLLPAALAVDIALLPHLPMISSSLTPLLAPLSCCLSPE